MRRVMRGDTLKKHLAAIAAALVLCGAMLAALALAGGVRHVPAKDLRSAYSSYEEVSSWDFMAGQYDALRDAGASPQLVFGSSELKGRRRAPRIHRASLPTAGLEARPSSRGARASKASAGNEYGFYDSWYREKFSAWLEGAQRAWHVQDGVYFSQQEFEDLELMLDVCREAGIEPLIVIQPVKGRAYDQTIYTHEVREAYYTTVRAVCDRAGVEVADFSSYEYDPLFLRDYSHPSAYGSALYSQALYDFWTK